MFNVNEISLHKFLKKTENQKHTYDKLNKFSSFRLFIFSALLIVTINFQAKSQVLSDSTKANIVNIQDSTLIALSDSLISSIDSSLVTKPDTIIKAPVGDIKTTVHYNAKDSITLNMFTRNVKIYGSGKIIYKPIELEAQEITVNWDDTFMQANGVADSTGRVQGKPIFKNGSEVYETNEIKYNFKTEKASITGLVTTQGDAFIHADKVLKNAKGELFNQTTLYTTCNLAHPHYSIKASKVKIIPNKEMIAGPFQMVINDVPTPIGFPFGMFPDQQNRTSGIIFPDFGEETIRGFYIRNGGYYFAINDNLNLDITGDIYTRGGWAVNARSAYYVRYKVRGNFSASFSKFKQENETTLEDDISNDFRLTWSHTPETKGTGRFSANVNYATASYNLNNLQSSREEQMNTSLSSTLSYSKTFTGTPFSMGLSGRYNQNLQTKLADFTLPDFSFNVQNIYPFKSKTSSGNKWYEKINIRYSMNATNKITNKLKVPSIDKEGKLISKDSTFDITSETIPFLLKNGSNGVKHNIPLSASFKLLKQFTVTPSIGYNEVWYFKKLDYSFNSELNKIETDTIKEFSAIRHYNTSASVNTQVYGTVILNREYGIQAIRHMMTPSISYTYNPDFGTEKYNYYQTVNSDTIGNTKTLSRYAGFVYGQGPSAGKNSSVSLSITNTLEMKYRNRKDTTNIAEKIALLRNFGVSTSYNFGAKEFKLADISLRASTDLLKNKKLGESITTNGLSINFSGNINPYIYQLDSITNEGEVDEKIFQTKLDQFAWNNGNGIGQLSRIQISMNTGFKAQQKGNTPTGGNSSGNTRSVGGGIEGIETNSFKEDAELNEFINNPDLYVDFNVPWSINFAYNVSFSKTGFIDGKPTQSLTFNGDISITEKTKVTFNSGYDFAKKKFNEMRFNVVRDLHCWDMTLSWIPNGRYQSYNFTIKAKSSLLQDLKLSKKRIVSF